MKYIIICRNDGRFLILEDDGGGEFAKFVLSLAGEVVYIFQSHENLVLKPIFSPRLTFQGATAEFCISSGAKVLMWLIETQEKIKVPVALGFSSLFYMTCDAAAAGGYEPAAAFRDHIRELDGALDSFCHEKVFSLRLGSLICNAAASLAAVAREKRSEDICGNG